MGIPNEKTPRRPRSERRRHLRAPYRFMVQYRSATHLLTGTVDDLSEGGLRLEVPPGIEVDHDVALALPLFGEGGRIEHCLVEGKVVRRDGQFTAVAFGRLLPKHLLQIRDFVWRSTQG